IPVDISLKSGLHYFWVSVTLKESADIDHKIELHCTGLTDSDNGTYRIVEEESDYAKRIAVAVRKAGDEGVDTYRIPGIVTTDKGTLIAVYDIRYDNSRDLPANIDVGLNRSTNGGKTWEPMKVIMDMGKPEENNGIGDASILFDRVSERVGVAAVQ